MLREELRRLSKFEERHRRLFARLTLAFLLTLVVFVIGTVLVWLFESGAKGGRINGIGDAAFFTAVQLLTISSQLPNPVTTPGRIVDIFLEAWAIFVVSAIAGSFASFFRSADLGNRQAPSDSDDV